MPISLIIEEKIKMHDLQGLRSEEVFTSHKQAEQHTVSSETCRLRETSEATIDANTSFTRMYELRRTRAELQHRCDTNQPVEPGNKRRRLLARRET